MACLNCRDHHRDKAGEDGFCPLCGGGLKAFMDKYGMRGWCQTKTCENYEELKKEGIPWFKTPPMPER